MAHFEFDLDGYDLQETKIDLLKIYQFGISYR